MKKILIIALFFASNAFSAEKAEISVPAGTVVMQNNVAGWKFGGYNFKIIKKSNKGAFQRIISYQDSVIIALPGETIEDLIVVPYGWITGSSGIQGFKFVKDKIPTCFMIYNKPYETWDLTPSITGNSKKLTLEELLPLSLINDRTQYNLFRYSPGMIKQRSDEFIKACFPGLQHRGILRAYTSRSGITSVDEARYILGIPDPSKEDPVYKEDVIDAYMCLKQQWELLKQYYPKESCEIILSRLDYAYKLLMDQGYPEHEKAEKPQEATGPLDIPVSFNDNTLSILGISRPATAYTVLGLTPQATQEEIKRKYRTLAREWHPDRNPQGALVFPLIEWAYSKLKPKSVEQQ